MTTWARLREVDALHPWVLDTLLAVLLFLGGALSVSFSGPAARLPDATFYLLLAVGSAPYALRRLAPLPVLVLATVPVLAMRTWATNLR